MNAESEHLLALLSRELPFAPTDEQCAALAKLTLFILKEEQNSIFILKGYAGTGKTSLVSALVRCMQKIRHRTLLLAPTGRAAKVLSHYSGQTAYTIHKAIYRQNTFQGEDTRFSLGFNRSHDTLFIVDEASMIANGGELSHTLFGTGQLLDDLLQYIYQGKGCKAIFVGDVAQLPPIGESESPALSPQVLGGYGFTVEEICLKEVARQESDSGILRNATYIRQKLEEGDLSELPRLRTEEDGDVRLVSGEEMVEELESCYSREGEGETIVITRSNKQANQYNNGIRQRTFMREEELSTGDLVMVVKNNYYWIEHMKEGMEEEEQKQLTTDFIANGDIARIVRVKQHIPLYGFHFARVELSFPDYGDLEMESVVLLDTLQSESPSLTREESQRLYLSVLEDYQHYSSKKERMKQLRSDPYYNALQIKYAYAVTCHKAQGGQWKKVFLYQGWLPSDALSADYLRWLYTSLTRATETLYLVNWPAAQQEGSSEEY